VKSYFDTNMIVALYSSEPLSSKAELEIKTCPTPLTITNLTELEFFSAISKKVRYLPNGLAKNKADVIIKKFKKHERERYYNKIILSESHYMLAKQWLEKLNHKLPLTTLDELHLSFVELEKMLLITSDRKLAKSATVLNINHKFISESDSR
jgi:uncharacterized protein